MAKILIVDSDSRTHTTLPRFLEPEKHEYFFATTGAEALKACKEIIPDLMIIDNELSDNSAIAVLRYLRTQKGLTDIPSIVTTASSSKQEKIQAISLGAFDYIEKPYEPVFLRARIEAIFRLKENHRRELEKLRLATIKDMALTLKHEVNNPLAGIIASAQLLRMQITDEEIQKRLSNIEELGFRISSLIETLRKSCAQEEELLNSKAAGLPH